MTFKGWLIIAAIVAFLASNAYSGIFWYNYKARLCNTEVLESKISTLQKQLDIANKSAEDATNRETILKTEADADDKKLEEYENALNDSPSCRATQSDVDQLR